MQSIHPVSTASNVVSTASATESLLEWRECSALLKARGFECVAAALVTMIILYLVSVSSDLSTVSMVGLRTTAIASGTVTLITGFLALLHHLRMGVIEVELYEHNITPH